MCTVEKKKTNRTNALSDRERTKVSGRTNPCDTVSRHATNTIIITTHHRHHFSASLPSLFPLSTSSSQSFRFHCRAQGKHYSLGISPRARVKVPNAGHKEGEKERERAPEIAAKERDGAMTAGALSPHHPGHGAPRGEEVALRCLARFLSSGRGCCRLGKPSSALQLARFFLAPSHPLDRQLSGRARAAWNARRGREKASPIRSRPACAPSRWGLASLAERPRWPAESVTLSLCLPALLLPAGSRWSGAFSPSPSLSSLTRLAISWLLRERLWRRPGSHWTKHTGLRAAAAATAALLAAPPPPPSPRRRRSYALLSVAPARSAAAPVLALPPTRALPLSLARKLSRRSIRQRAGPAYGSPYGSPTHRVARVASARH